MSTEAGSQLALITDYLTGECSPDERKRLESWMAQSADNQALVHDLGRAWERIRWHQDAPVDVDALVARVAAETGLTGLQGRLSTTVLQRPSEKRHNRYTPAPVYGRRMMWYTAAGVVAMMFGVFVGLRGGLRSTKVTPGNVSTYATTNGERATLTLLDGTKVSLGVASRLDVPADFSAGNRTVKLTGQALFTVSHHERTPFTVVAGLANARVLGTTFAVRYYTSDSMVTVAVRDGKVAVGTEILTAQQLVQVGRNGTSAVQSASNGAFSFATGTLSLDYMKLSDAIPELNRWYDVDIRLGSAALAQQHIKGEFAAGSLSDLANILKLTFDVRVVRDGRVLTLYPGSSR